MIILHAMAVFFGLASPNSPFYLFWSGSGADFTRLALIGGVVKLVDQHTKNHRELVSLHERHHRERMEAH